MSEFEKWIDELIKEANTIDLSYLTDASVERFQDYKLNILLLMKEKLKDKVLISKDTLDWFIAHSEPMPHHTREFSRLFDWSAWEEQWKAIKKGCGIE